MWKLYRAPEPSAVQWPLNSKAMKKQRNQWLNAIIFDEKFLSYPSISLCHSRLYPHPSPERKTDMAVSPHLKTISIPSYTQNRGSFKYRHVLELKMHYEMRQPKGQVIAESNWITSVAPAVSPSVLVWLIYHSQKFNKQYKMTSESHILNISDEKLVLVIHCFFHRYPTALSIYDRTLLVLRHMLI